MTETTHRKRVVVKVGTSTLIHETGSLNLQNIDHLSRALSDLKGIGHEIILVSSGAIGIGACKLRMPQRPAQLRLKQATAAVGQCEMMHLYDKFFGEYGQTVAQILLTREDVDHPHRSENLKATFEALLEMGTIPVVNENDSVAFDEIETGRTKVLGDNDTLSALVAALVNAGLLILLSDIDGLFDGDPRSNPNARLIPAVHEINGAVRAIAGGNGTSWGTGGMSTKLDAAEIALENGIDMVITNGKNMENLYKIVNGNPVGTLFSRTI
ncbi:MAG: glutamate 5-kinase [Oscillospiraceae bacterium]|nr:glutamate 5-kinase [Oscillospiraceae bacterium]